MILVDSNVLLDLVTDDPSWAEWSQQALDAAALRDRLAINDVVYAEVSIRYSRIEALDGMLERAGIVVERSPKAALFLAGKAHMRYRAAAGSRRGVLPDFFIGAHAAVRDWPLITRAVARYRTYFPTVSLICPG